MNDPIVVNALMETRTHVDALAKHALEELERDSDLYAKLDELAKAMIKLTDVVQQHLVDDHGYPSA